MPENCIIKKNLGGKGGRAGVMVVSDSKDVNNHWWFVSHATATLPLSFLQFRDVHLHSREEYLELCECKFLLFASKILILVHYVWPRQKAGVA